MPTVSLAFYSTLNFATIELPLILAQSGGDLSTFKKGLSLVGALMAAFGALRGVALIQQGGEAKAKGDPNAYNAIKGGLIIAGAFLIMGIILGAFGLRDFLVDPEW